MDTGNRFCDRQPTQWVIHVVVSACVVAYDGLFRPAQGATFVGEYGVGFLLSIGDQHHLICVVLWRQREKLVINGKSSIRNQPRSIMDII